MSHLNLNYNQIINLNGAKLPQSLSHLLLANNQIQKIEDIDSLHALEKLDLSFNYLSYLEGLKLPENLKQISFDHNLLE